jgi:hypothetical protein
MSISTDFEQAALNALRSSFSEATLFGCLFHLVKNMKRKLADQGLLPLYNSDGDFALAARMIVALAFVPMENLEAAFEELSGETSEVLHPIVDWFEDNYMRRPNRRGGRRPATFPPEIWNVFERTINGDNRTNNYAEAAHRRMQVEMGMDHPSIWKFIKSIRIIQSGRDQSFEEFIRGNGPTPKRRKYVQTDERILTILNDRGNRTYTELLRGIAHNFLMN